MKITTFSVRYGRKLNLGNYETANFEIELSAEIEPDDDFHEVQRSLWSTARYLVKQQASDLIGKVKSKEQKNERPNFVFDWSEANGKE